MVHRNGFVSGIVILACIVVVLWSADQALAQGAVTTATLAGDVFDREGAVLPGAKVAVKNEATGFTREAVSNERGQFVVSQLPAGSYEVSVELAGFKKALIHDVLLNIGATETLRVSLDVGELTESIDVSAQAVPTIESTKTDVSSYIQSVQVRELPLNQRSFTELVVQQPGMVQMTNTSPPSPTADRGNVGSYISAGGLMGSNVAYLMDGVSINNAGFTAPGTVAGGDIPGVEAIQEFKVLTNNYSAAYGGAAGAVVSFATRSGTNASHGSVYEFLRNDALDARGPFDTLDRTGDGKADLPPFRRNQFGATFGGPIRRDQTFFFTNYEGLRERLTTTGIGFVPSLAARNGGVGGTSGFPVIGPIRQPDGTYQRGPVAIPAGVRALLELYPLPNGPDLGNGIAQLSFADRRPVRQDFGLVRIDHTLSQKDLLMGRYSITDADASSAFNLPTFLFARDSRLQNLVVQWTRTISASMVNTLSLGLVRSLNRSIIEPAVPVNPLAYTGNPARQIVGPITVGSLVAASVGGAGGLSLLGNDPSAPLQVVKNYFPVNDDLVMTRGGHSLKFGGMIQRMQDNWITAPLFGGNWNFGNVNDFLAGNPTLTLIFVDGGNPSFGYRTTLMAWYVEDAWRARPNLTLTLGLRHEFQAPILKEVNGKLGNFRNPQSRQLTVGQPFNNYSLKQFQPRLGIAYDPFRDGKTVIRAGAGVFNSYISLGDIAPFTVFNTPKPATQFVFGEPIAPGAIPPLPFPACPSCTAPTGFPGLVLLIRNPVSSPTSVQWYLQVDRELYRNLKFSATYQGSQSSHIVRDFEGNYNLPCTINGRRVFDNRCGTAAPDFANIAFLVLNQAYDTNASYHAMTLGVSRSYASGLTFNANYTFAKVLSESDANFGTLVGTAVGTQNPADRKLDRAESVFSVRHRFTVNTVYELPFGRGKQFFNKASGATQALLGGWSINALGTFQSGFPFSVLDGFGITGIGDNLAVPDRPNLIRSNTELGRVNRWFDPKAYALQEPGTLGTAARTSARGPSFKKLDFSVGKTFELGEKVGLQFRAEFFNIANRSNFGLPLNQLYIGNSPQFNRVPTQAELDALLCNLTAAQAQQHSCNPVAGTITRTVSTPRQIQFGLKLMF
ncbi:MAG: TonB-dependent receptor [Acidobacteria bacterium]|nr:TonB-dependent receptor [Acidobacteriota bacterium]